MLLATIVALSLQVVDGTAVTPLTERAREWSALIRSRVPSWTRQVETIAAPYHPARPPAQVTIVLDHGDGTDASVRDSTTVVFDLAALARNYGDPNTAENQNMIDRLFLHEYAHLAQNAWLDLHPFPTPGALEAALRAIWREALGNRISMSARWRANHGVPSDTAATTLDELSPRFVARIAAIGCAAEPEARALMADLSAGPFSRKWGALPAALWLEAEASRSPDAIRSFIEAGPGGVWDLAARHLPPALSQVLEEARTAAARCHAP